MSLFVDLNQEIDAFRLPNSINTQIQLVEFNQPHYTLESIAIWSDGSIVQSNIRIVDGNILTSNNGTSINMSVPGTINLLCSSLLLNNTPVDVNQYLLKSGDAMSGSLNMTNHNIINVANVNNKAVNTLITNQSPSVHGNIATFAGTSGTNLQDSGLNISAIPQPSVLRYTQWVPTNPVSEPTSTTPFSLFQNPTSFSSLVFPMYTTQDGTTITIKGTLDVTMQATTTLNINVTKNGTTVVENTFSPGAVLTKQPLIIEARIQILDILGVGRFAVGSLQMFQNGQTSQIVLNSTCGWDLGEENTLDMLATFNDTNGGLNIFIMTVDTMARLA